LPSSHHQQPAPDLTTAAWDRRSPPTAFVASTGARAGVAGPARGLQVWIDVLREGGHPAAAGSSSAHHLRPAGQAFDPFLAEIAVHYSTLRQVTRDDVTGMARRSQTSGQ